MEKKIHVIYEHGVLKPLEPLMLEEKQEMDITISECPNLSQREELLRQIDEVREKIGKKFGITSSIPILREIRSER